MSTRALIDIDDYRMKLDEVLAENRQMEAENKRLREVLEEIAEISYPDRIAKTVCDTMQMIAKDAIGGAE